jgi:ribonuclease P/MRP protein subunit POP1
MEPAKSHNTGQTAHSVLPSLDLSAKHPGAPSYPEVPDEIDLIGFITTGNFNLAEGKGIGIGSLLFSKLFFRDESQDGALKINGSSEASEAKVRNLCIIRDAGERFGRLARWELIDIK